MNLRARVYCLTLICALIPPLFGGVGTLRVDYYHTGTATEEHFSLDRVVVEPLPWPGNPTGALDDTNLGKYYFEVVDRSNNQVLYSRGFASIYGEWETTGEARRMHKTFHESLRFPRPDSPVQVVVKKRDSENTFREAWSLTVDPEGVFVDPSSPPSPGALMEIQKSGASADKVDFLVLGDGYSQEEVGKCESDARRLAELLFETSPFQERRNDFNVWLLCPPAEESGVSRPSTGVHKRSPLGVTYDFFGSERYAMTVENRTFRDIASFAPYEFVEILVNERTYGGGGIFGLYGTVAADNAYAPYVFVHEFGHHFAGLADEYYTSSVAYEDEGKKIEPWEANATALADPGKLKWRDLVEASTPVPTPWQKAEFEEHAREIQAARTEIRKQELPESEMEKLFAEQSDWETALFSKERFRAKVGAFEGANYASRGYFRPEVDCIMFSRNNVPFCKVCQRTINRVIDLYSR